MTPEQDRLVLDNVKLAYWALRGFRGHGMEIEDLEQLALEGLVRAAQAFKPELGFTFGTFATRVIRNLLIDHHTGTVKRQRRDVVSGTVEEHPVDDTRFDFVESVADALAFFDTLEGRDRDIVALYAAGNSQRAVGAVVGVTQNIISRDMRAIRRRALVA